MDAGRPGVLADRRVWGEGVEAMAGVWTDVEFGCAAGLPHRWKVERTLGWVMNVRDYERLPQHSEAHLTWALITVMTKRLTRRRPARSWSRKTTTAR